MLPNQEHHGTAPSFVPFSTSRERNAGQQLDSLTAFINSASHDEMPRKCNLGSERAGSGEKEDETMESLRPGHAK